MLKIILSIIIFVVILFFYLHIHFMREFDRSYFYESM